MLQILPPNVFNIATILDSEIYSLARTSITSVFLAFIFVYESAGQQLPLEFSIEKRIAQQEQVLNHPVYYPDYPVWGFVHQMVKDHEGFFWICAEPGLVRFDGKQFKKYLHDPKDSTSLSNDNVFTIWEDSIRQEIWFGTMNGISVLDTKTNKFRRCQASNSNLPDVYIRSIYGDRQGQIWIGTKHGGFLEYDRKADTFIQQFPADSLNDLDYKYTYTIEILQDRSLDSILWLGTGYGLIRWNKATKKYKRYLYHNPNVPENIHNLQNLHLHIYQHDDGRIFNANYRGVNIFDPKTERIKHVDPYGGDYNDNRARYRTRKIGQWSKNELYISLYDGLVLFDLKQERVIKTWKHQRKQSYYTVLTKDNQGDLWGASEVGLIQYPVVRSAIRHYSVPHNGRNTAIHKMVLLEDKNESTLHIGTSYQDGLLKLDLNSGDWTTIRAPSNLATQGSPFMIMDGDFTPEGDVIIAQYSQLYQYSKGESILKEYPIQPIAEFNHYRSLIVASNGHIWAGTQENGLVRIIPELDTFVIYKEELSLPENPNHFKMIHELYEDKENHIWIQNNMGYSVYLPEKDTFLNYVYQDTAAIAFLDHHDFAQDDLGHLWLTGREGGMGISLSGQLQNGMDTFLFADREDLKHFEQVGKDADGQIWVSVDHRGWLQIDPKTQRAKLIPAQWISGRLVRAFKRLSDGKLAIGYGRTVIVFDPEDLPEINERPKPYLDELLLFNKPFFLLFLLRFLPRLIINCTFTTWMMNLAMSFGNQMAL